MTLIQTLQLEAPPQLVWDLLVEQSGALRLLSGLTAGPDGRGTLRVALAGHSVTYRGYARQHVEEPNHRVTWTLSGREVRGTGRGHAEIRARVKELAGGGTDLRLTVLIEGKGRLAEVTEDDRELAVASLIGRFGKNLKSELPAPEAPAAEREWRGSGHEAAPQLEIVPPSLPNRGTAARAAALAAAGLLAGALAVLVWRARSRR
ncbi:MAG TPA: hypothetical protein VMV23_03300 [Candidatus Nanopelagicaceae bacterium]|nr:hypothetical protein [Candidatus Nanopelagicaceae bacterium]